MDRIDALRISGCVCIIADEGYGYYWKGFAICPACTDSAAHGSGAIMSEDTDDLVRAVTELIGNIRRVKNVAAMARPGGPRSKETKKLIGEMSRALRRHRKKLEASLLRHDCTEDQRRLATEHIQLILLAEAEAESASTEVAN